MRLRVTTLLPLLCLIGLLTACSSTVETVPVVEYVNRTPPPALLSCSEAPSPPIRLPGQSRSQRSIARYIVDLHEAWADCHATVGAIRGLYEGE